MNRTRACNLTSVLRRGRACENGRRRAQGMVGNGEKGDVRSERNGVNIEEMSSEVVIVMAVVDRLSH